MTNSEKNKDWEEVRKIMKKLLLVLVCVALASFLFVGCLPDWVTPEPEEPVSEMEAVALAELDDAGETILWSIINTGDVFIREYTLEFKVEYPDVVKDYFAIEMTGEYLEVDDIHSGEIDITVIAYDVPESVSVIWELFE